MKERTAEPWDFCYSSQEVEPEIPRLAEMLESENRCRVLDFGCGAGRHTLYFASRGFEVSAFDKSAKAVELLKSALARSNVRANVHVQDMLAPLPYEAASFDCVLATKVIQHAKIPDITRIFREISRILKTNGILFLQVTSYGDTFGNKPGINGWLEPGTIRAGYGPEKGVIHHFFRKEELLRFLQNYEVVEIHSGSAGHYNGYCVIARKIKGPE